MAKVVAALTEHWEAAETPDAMAPVRDAPRYLSNRVDGLDYPRALALGLPIGSGMIEFGHRHVLQARPKKAGAAWLLERADRIASLPVLRANGQWANMWNESHPLLITPLQARRHIFSEFQRRQLGQSPR